MARRTGGTMKSAQAKAGKVHKLDFYDSENIGKYYPKCFEYSGLVDGFMKSWFWKDVTCKNCLRSIDRRRPDGNQRRKRGR